MLSFVFKNILLHRAFYEVMCKNVVQPNMPQMTM